MTKYVISLELYYLRKSEQEFFDQYIDILRLLFVGLKFSILLNLEVIITEAEMVGINEYVTLFILFIITYSLTVKLWL